MKKNKIYPIHYKSTDDSYNTFVGICWGACLCNLFCISLILILYLTIEMEPIFENSGSGLIL
jgi:hypothetical protein